MGWRRRWFLALASAPAAIVACNALNGSGDLEIVDGDGAAALPDRVGTDQGLDVVVDGAAGDAGFDAPCVPRPTLLEAGVLAAYAAGKPKKVDGLFDDWGCETPLVLDRSSVDFAFGDAGTLRAEVRVEWEPGHLNVAYVVVTRSPPTGASTQAVFDDAVEVYASPPGPPSGGDYRPVDRHYAVDYRGVAQSYEPYEAGVPAGGGFDSKAVVTPDGFDVELRIAPKNLGVASFAAGDVIPFDLQIDVGDGNQQLGALIWANTESSAWQCSCSATCCCGAPTGAPFCDTHRFGTLVLQP